MADNHVNPPSKGGPAAPSEMMNGNPFAQLFPNQPTGTIELPIGAMNLLFKKLMEDCPYTDMKESSACNAIAMRLREVATAVQAEYDQQNQNQTLN